MCDKYCNCGFCNHDKNDCQEMGDGSPFCGMFQCIIQNCQRFECISYDELYDVYNDDVYNDDF